MPPFCEKMGFCPSTTINLVQVEPKRGAPDLTQNDQTRSSFLSSSHASRTEVMCLLISVQLLELINKWFVPCDGDRFFDE